MNNITCFKCNQELPVQANYCFRCGVRLSDATSSEKLIVLLEHIVKTLENHPVNTRQSNNGNAVTKTITFDDLPDILTAKHISEHIHLTKQQIYNLFAKPPSAGGIPSFSIGKSRRANKNDYMEWLSNHTNR